MFLLFEKFASKFNYRSSKRSNPNLFFPQFIFIYINSKQDILSGNFDFRLRSRFYDKEVTHNNIMNPQRFGFNSYVLHPNLIRERYETI